MNRRTDTGATYLSRGESCGNCRAMETVEKSSKGRGLSLTDFSTSFHSAWQTLRNNQKSGEVSTVSPASGAELLPKRTSEQTPLPQLVLRGDILPCGGKPASGRQGAGCQRNNPQPPKE